MEGSVQVCAPERMSSRACCEATPGALFRRHQGRAGGVLNGALVALASACSSSDGPGADRNASPVSENATASNVSSAGALQQPAAASDPATSAGAVASAHGGESMGIENRDPSGVDSSGVAAVGAGGTSAAAEPSPATAGGSAGAVAPAEGAAPQLECPKPAGEVCHEFFVNDNALNRINYVNEFDPSKNWSQSVNAAGGNSPRQVELVDNPQGSRGKAVMVSVDTGYQEYDIVTGTRLVDVVLPGTTGVRGAIRLPDGNTALTLGSDQLRIIRGNGTTVSECTLPGTAPDALRVLGRDAENGDLFFGRLVELFAVNDRCEQRWAATLPMGGKAYSVIPREGGGVWASSGDLATVIGYDAQGQITTFVGGINNHPNIGLSFTSGFEVLANGNIVTTNWLGHLNPEPTAPHLLEFTPANELVWRWGSQDLARQITDTLVLR